MKKSVKIALIIAGVMIVSGLILGLIGYSSMGFSFSMLKSEPHHRSFDVQDKFTKIDIKLTSTDLIVMPSEDSAAKVDTRSHEKVTYKVENVNGTLTVTEQDDREWIDRLSLFSDPSTMTVYLPEEAYEQLNIELTSGDFIVPEGLSFDEIKIDATSGDAVIEADCKKRLDITCTTGKVCLNGLTTDDFSVKSTTGDISFSSCRGKNLSATCTTGEIHLVDVVLDDSIKASASTGDITFSRVDASSLDLHVTTGEIKGSLLTPKKFSAHSSIGRVEVPATTGKGTCTATASTGDIEITVGK